MSHRLHLSNSASMGSLPSSKEQKACCIDGCCSFQLRSQEQLAEPSSAARESKHAANNRCAAVSSEATAQKPLWADTVCVPSALGSKQLPMSSGCTQDRKQGLSAATNGIAGATASAICQRQFCQAAVSRLKTLWPRVTCKAEEKGQLCPHK